MSRLNIAKPNLSLLVDLYELTMAESYFEHKKDTLATFDLFVRSLPKSRSYLIACGLEEVIRYLDNLSFDEESINYLKNLGDFKEDFLNYLRDFRFSGDLFALPEGTLFFSNEPILRVTAPIIEAQLIESFLINTINISSLIATKASRVVLAARERGVYDFSLRRTHGIDASLKVARASYIAGCRGSSNTLAGLIYKIPVAGTMAHSYVMSFENELESFRAFSNTFPGKSILLVDTYNNIKGIENAMVVAKELESKGFRLKAIRIDSGDLLKISQIARRMLDKAKLSYVEIFASGNLDEYKIASLIKDKAPIDNFGVGTNMGVSEDAPYLDIIYKITEVTDLNGRFLPTMKLSRGKVTYPGRKQIFRITDKKGMYLKDILGLEKEDIRGRPLLAKVVDKGKIIAPRPSLEEIRKNTKDNLDCLPSRYKSLRTRGSYPIQISKGLEALTHRLSRVLEMRARQ